MSTALALAYPSAAFPIAPAARPVRNRHRSLSTLDVEILRFLTRFQIARPHHVAGWTGASPHTVARRLRVLAEQGLARKYVTSIALRGTDGAVRDTTCTVWTATGAGAGLIGSWTVPGFDEPITLPAPRISHLTTHHTIGVADLAVWYRQVGFTLIAEREILSLERPNLLNRSASRPTAKQFWSTTIPGRTGIHPPDLGAVAPDGGMWCVELERATKTVGEYEDIIRAYQKENVGQVWHILTQATAKRVQEACRRLGEPLAADPVGGVLVSRSGLIRLQGWLPGRAGLAGPTTWTRQFPRSSPAGIPVPAERPDLTASWRTGRVVDVEADEFGGGVFW